MRLATIVMKGVFVITICIWKEINTDKVAVIYRGKYEDRYTVVVDGVPHTQYPSGDKFGDMCAADNWLNEIYAPKQGMKFVFSHYVN